MEEKQTFAVQALVATLVLNAILLAAIYLIAGDALAGRTTAVLGAGVVITLILWFVIRQLGQRFIERAAAAAVPAAPPAPAELPVQEAKAQRPRASEASVIHLLSILQRRGRFIDFLQEDLRLYDDAQIGAAVRNIQEGCKEALAEYVEVEPIFKEEEGSEVTLPPGFDARAVRLIGDVMGEPPFKGALRHRGWRVVRVDLPERVHGGEKEEILAAAEVEVHA